MMTAMLCNASGEK